MALAALLVALLALPLALFDVRIALGLVLFAALLAVFSLYRGHWAGVGKAALAVALIGSLLMGWEMWEANRPVADTAPSLPAQLGEDREVLLPLTVTRAPITALAILDFEDGQDEIYESLEPQVIDRGDERGVRIIGYRHDGYADLYDDLTLSPDPDESAAVVGKGRLHYEHTDLCAVFDVDEEGHLTLEFSFEDVAGREITGVVREGDTRSSVPLDLLAPVGLSSTDPEYFPLFLVRDFEFVRTRGGELDVRIDGNAIGLDKFPVPLPVRGEMRSFSKFSTAAEIIEVFPTTASDLRTVRTEGDRFREGESTYVFDGDDLERVVVAASEIVFEPALDLERTGHGRLTMTSHPDLGRISGEYRTEVSGTETTLEIDLVDTEAPRQRGLLYSAIINDRSAFARWPQEYRFHATIDRDAQTIDAQWVNARPGG